jgi:pyruvate dehydrogenase E1 component alpha subunit
VTQIGRSTTTATFEIRHRACLDETGRALGPLADFAADRRQLVELYAAMTRVRRLDAEAIALQRTGRLGTYASSLGQEAVAVGLAAAMRADDVLVPSFREHGAQLWRGVTMTEFLLFWGGDERGSAFAGPRGDFPVCIPVGDQFAHATGAALAFAARGEDRVAVVAGGDGATSKGEFYEAMNLAGVWRLPVVFVIVNNQWAISVRRSAQTAAATLAQKALAAGLTGEQVDGSDVVAVRAGVGEAVERARAGGGAGVVECLTYRLADHTTADDASRYRDDAEVTAAWAREPLRRLRAHLAAVHGWTRDEEEALRAAVRAEVEAAVAAYLATPPQSATAVVDHLFAALPADLVAARGRLESHGHG